jgi:hypothetical protein
MRRSIFASIVAGAGLLMAAQSAPAFAAPSATTPRRTNKTQGKGSIDYAARAARSHAGKPVGYVKAY